MVDDGVAEGDPGLAVQMHAPMKHPFLLELNTRCWLHEVSQAAGRDVRLSDVPEDCFGDWVRMGISHIWLMGVWATGPMCRAKALTNSWLRAAYDRELPGWAEADVWGSPYAVAGYDVPDALGGMEGVARFRQRLHGHGLKLVLDFVPNHHGMDHPWLESHPEYFVPADRSSADGFALAGKGRERWLAHGRDPYFAPWSDTVQLDYRSQCVHDAMTAELLNVARVCDGVRCDMAMLLLNEVFAATWKQCDRAEDAGPPAGGEFWEQAIARVREVEPGFLFLAEAYWGLEPRLQSMGFDYTYAKDITDAFLDRRPAEGVGLLQQRAPDILNHSAHFLENHDERRVAAVLPFEEHRVAALAVLGLPGMRFLHDGQTRGARVRTSVQLGRRQVEPCDQAICKMYEDLLSACARAGVGQGKGRVLQTVAAWAGNPTAGNILVIHWVSGPNRQALVVLNVASHPSQCRVPMAVGEGAGESWRLTDLLRGERWVREAGEMRAPGLFLDLEAHAAQVIIVEPAT